MRTLARAADECGATLVHYGSDFVFAGDRADDTPYDEAAAELTSVLDPQGYDHHDPDRRSILFPAFIWLATIRSGVVATGLVVVFSLFYTLGLALFTTIHPLF